MKKKLFTVLCAMVMLASAAIGQSYVPGTGGSSAAQLASGTVSSAQITTLNASPITLVAAQGAGKIVVPIYVNMKYNYGGTAYSSSSGRLSLVDNTGSAAYNITAMPNTVMTGSSTQYNYTFGAGGGSTAISAENHPILLWNPQTPEFSGGNGTVEYNILYVVIAY